MASTNWIEIYETVSDAELATEIAEMKAQQKKLRGIAAQSAGSRSYTSDMDRLEAQLGAAVRVQRGRASAAANGNTGFGVVDFSRR